MSVALAAETAGLPDFARSRVVPGVSPGRGRGLFAAAPIGPGEVIERCCTIPLTSEQCDRLETILPLGDYYFRHPEDPDEGLLLLGLASLANHADEPNGRIAFEWHAAIGWVAALIALRRIETGEEITHRYRCPPWFAVA